MTVDILVGDCRDVLKTLPDESVQCVVTSPPYWGLRAYLDPAHPDKSVEMGSEPTPGEYIANMVAVFREVRRVLRADGVMWVNMGDAFQDKQLMGIPWRLAFALQDDGWYLRSDCIWHKPNPMPESVTDRPTKSHEYVFLLTKSARYYYDQEAVREAGNGTWNNSGFRNGGEGKYIHDSTINNSEIPERQYSDKITMPSTSRNLRDVWTIPTFAYPGCHYATYPPALVEPCVKAGTSERGCCPQCGKPWERVVKREQYSDSPNSYPVGDRRDKCPSSSRMNVNGAQPQQSHVMSIATTTGWRPGCECDAGEPVACTILDPFSGAGTTGLVADRLGRHAILIELNADYAAMAERRIREDNPMFTQVRVR